MRVENSIKNLSTAWISQLILLMLKFVNRTFFVMYLGAVYLGVNGLFSNILSMLSLADLGVGSAIIYSLYKPIAENDKNQMSALMQLFKKVYIGVGFFILIAGCSLTPFLNFFIKDIPENIENISLIYVLFVINSGITYFYSYKSSFIIANQKNYVVTINHIVFTTFCTLAQVVILVLTRNFLIYLCIQIIITFIENYNISRMANKMFPFLKERQKRKLEKVTKNQILKNTSAMIFHKLGSIIVFSTDNLVLSKVVGLVSVGIYSNYSLIIVSVENIISQIFNSITASVGNLRVTSSLDKQKKVFKTLNFINFWIYTICTTCLLNLINPFITLWLGNHYVFENYIVLILVLNFYLSGMRKSILTFKDAFGLFWENRYMPIFESLINLVCSITLANLYGPIGVFIGTTISTVLTSLWIEPLVLFRYGFKMKSIGYFINYFKKFVIIVFICMVSIYVNSFISICNLGFLILKLIISLFISNGIIFLIYRKTDEYLTLLEYIKLIIKTLKLKLVRRE